MSGNDGAVNHEDWYELVQKQFSMMLNDEEDPVIRHLIENDDTFSVKTYLFLKKENTNVQKYEIGLHLLRTMSDFYYLKMLHSTCMCVASNTKREHDTQYHAPRDGQHPSTDGVREDQNKCSV